MQEEGRRGKGTAQSPPPLSSTQQCWKRRMRLGSSHVLAAASGAHGSHTGSPNQAHRQPACCWSEWGEVGLLERYVWEAAAHHRCTQAMSVQKLAWCESLLWGTYVAAWRGPDSGSLTQQEWKLAGSNSGEGGREVIFLKLFTGSVTETSGGL